MNPFVDGVMLFLFVLFMVFIFGGYHKTKFAQREKESQREEENKKQRDELKSL